MPNMTLMADRLQFIWSRNRHSAPSRVTLKQKANRTSTKGWLNANTFNQCGHHGPLLVDGCGDSPATRDVGCCSHGLDAINHLTVVGVFESLDLYLGMSGGSMSRFETLGFLGSCPEGCLASGKDSFQNPIQQCPGLHRMEHCQPMLSDRKWPQLPSGCHGSH